MFGRKKPKPTFVEARPTLGERLSWLRGGSRLGDEPRRGGLLRWILLPWVLVTAPVRAVFSGLNFLLLRGGQVGAGLRSRQLRHLLLGLPSVFAALAVLVTGGMVLGRTDELREVYEKAANGAFAAKEYKKAHLYFERLYDLDDGSAQTRYSLGLTLDQLDRPDEAMRLISGVAEGDAGGNFRANSWVAAKLLENEELRNDPFVRATIYRNLLKAHRGLPRSIEVKLNLANYHLMTGDFRKAIPYLEEAAELNPVVNIDLAQFYSLDGRPNSAKTALERAETHLRAELDRNPVDQETRVLLAKTTSMQGEFGKVLELLEEGRALDPAGPYPRLIAQTHVAIYDRLALESERDYSRMIGHLREALRYQPGMTDAIVRLVSFGEETSDQTERPAGAPVDPEIVRAAREMLLEMLAKGDHSPEVHMALGLKAWRGDDFETALRHFEAAYDLDPSIAEVANNLAWILTHQQIPQHERALAIINSVIERHPTVRRFRDTRGEIYMALGQWDEAIRDLEFALPDLADDPRIHASLAKAYEAQGHTELAEKHRAEGRRLQSDAEAAVVSPKEDANAD